MKMRLSYWFFGAGAASLLAALALQGDFFMWAGLAALVVGSLLPGGREDGGFGDAGGDGGD
jgi:membrane protein implicated in regulation of membrane protease activity